MAARRLVNAVCHQYLVPGFQVGAKATVNQATGVVEDAFAVSRMLGAGAICMTCSGLIDATRLALEAMSEEERRAAEYVTGIAQPSVITMNAMSTALALNDFLFMFTGLNLPTADPWPRRYHFMERSMVQETGLPVHVSCPECAGRKAKGDRASLPVRRRTPE